MDRRTDPVSNSPSAHPRQPQRASVRVQVPGRPWPSLAVIGLITTVVAGSLPSAQAQTQPQTQPHTQTATKPPAQAHTPVQNKGTGASATPPKAAPATEPKARPWMACFDMAAAHHGVSADVLRAIADQESSMRPGARNQNTDGTEDLGLMQINSLWFAELARRGVSVAQLLDPCTNIHAGAWILSKQIERFGNTWRAVGAYHSKTPEHNARYAWGVYRRLSRADKPAAPPAPTTAAGLRTTTAALSTRTGTTSDAEPSYPLE